MWGCEAAGILFCILHFAFCILDQTPESVGCSGGVQSTKYWRKKKYSVQKTLLRARMVLCRRRPVNSVDGLLDVDVPYVQSTRVLGLRASSKCRVKCIREFLTR